MSFEAEIDERDRIYAEILRRTPGVPPERLPAKTDDGGYEATWIDVRGYPPNLTYALLYRERAEVRIVLQCAAPGEFVEAVIQGAA